MTVRGDNVTTLTMVCYFKGSTPQLAIIAREIALVCARATYKPAIVEHVPGVATCVAFRDRSVLPRWIGEPGDAAVLGSAFMLREIELAAARLSHVNVDTSVCSFSLKLPNSKTDHAAIGCSRSWSCVCDTGVQVSRVCPHHTSIRHLERVTAFRNSLCGLDCSCDFPLFLCAVGTTVKKEKIVECPSKRSNHLLVGYRQLLNGLWAMRSSVP